MSKLPSLGDSFKKIVSILTPDVTKLQRVCQKLKRCKTKENWVLEELMRTWHLSATGSGGLSEGIVTTFFWPWKIDVKSITEPDLVQSEACLWDSYLHRTHYWFFWAIKNATQSYFTNTFQKPYYIRFLVDAKNFGRTVALKIMNNIHKIYILSFTGLLCLRPQGGFFFYH